MECGDQEINDWVFSSGLGLFRALPVLGFIGSGRYWGITGLGSKWVALGLDLGLWLALALWLSLIPCPISRVLNSYAI